MTCGQKFAEFRKQRTLCVVIGAVAGLTIGLVGRNMAPTACSGKSSCCPSFDTPASCLGAASTWGCGWHSEMWLSDLLGYPGKIFIRGLTLVVLPYICTSMFVSQKTDPDADGDNGMGGRAIMMYSSTTIMAVTAGLISYNIFRPGSGTIASTSNVTIDVCSPANSVYSSAAGHSTLGTILSIGAQVVPKNVVKAYNDMNLLGLIVFFIIFGRAVNKQTGPGRDMLFEMMVTMQDASMSIIMWLVEVTPIGIMSLIAGGVAKPVKTDSAVLGSLAMFMVTALFALSIHACITLPLMLRSFSNFNVPKYYNKLRPAMAMAFGTSSSAATLPVTMSCAATNGLDEDVINFVFPLGATVNMDGSAIYYCQVVIYISALIGHPMTFAEQLKTGFIGAAITCGAAPIPGGMVVWLYMIMRAADVPEDPRISTFVAMILTVDWFMDRARTTINVVGDSVVAAIVQTHVNKSRPPGDLQMEMPSANVARMQSLSQEPKGAPDTELSQGFQTSHTESDIHD